MGFQSLVEELLVLGLGVELQVVLVARVQWFVVGPQVVELQGAQVVQVQWFVEEVLVPQVV